MSAKPFVKWVGGKTQLLPIIRPLIKKSYPIKRYVEPFVGGGAVFWEVARAESYLINDLNEDLMITYQMVKSKPDELIESVQKVSDYFLSLSDEARKAYYLKVRELDRTEGFGELSLIARATRFIFLNKAGYSGLHRVNLRGEVNMDYGDYKQPKFIDVPNILACSEKLQNCEIMCTSFVNIEPKRGDFWFMDPPYVDISPDRPSFKDYTKERFTDDDQRDIANLMDLIDKCGGKFIVTNHDTPFTRKLYRKYKIKKVSVRRVISSDTNKRGAEKIEIIVTNF